MNRDFSKIAGLNERLESLKYLSWDDLSHELMHLDIEFNNIKKFLKPSEVKLYQDFIHLYEVEKHRRFPKIIDYSSYTFGPRPACAGWVEISEKDIQVINDDEDFE